MVAEATDSNAHLEARGLQARVLPARYLLDLRTWIDPATHNAMIGCMVYQRHCPEDKPFLDWFEADTDFSEEETTLVLRGARAEDLLPETRAKLERLELFDSLEALPRNLGVLLEPEA